MSSRVYTNFKLELGQKAESFSADTFKAALFTSSYTPNLDTDTTYAGLTGEVAAGSGYSTGGVTLASVTWGTLAPTSYGAAWAATTAYSLGQIVVATATPANFFLCVVAGTSGSTQPTWGSIVGQAQTDGTVTWLNIASKIVKLGASNLTWAVTGVITYRYVVLYDSTTGDLVALYDPGANQSGPSSGTLNVNWDANAGVAVFY